MTTGRGNQDRTCPLCESDSVCSVREARAAFCGLYGWGSTAMLDDASHVCSTCHAVRIGGGWERMQSVRTRAWELSQASSNSDKDASYYEDFLTSGEEPSAGTPDSPSGTPSTEGGRDSVRGVEW